MHEKAEDLMVKEKLQRVNEPGVVVKCVFDRMTVDAEMDDIKDIAENLPENLRNAITQTEVSNTTVGIQTSELHNSMLQPESYFQRKLYSADFDEPFFAGNNKKVKFYTGLPSLEILQKVFS